MNIKHPFTIADYRLITLLANIAVYEFARQNNTIANNASIISIMQGHSK